MSASTPARDFIFPMTFIVFCWGMNFTVMKWALQSVDPIAFRALAAASATTALFALLTYRRRSLALPRSQWGMLVAYSLLTTTVFPITSTYGIALLPSGRAAILAYTMPIWAVTLSVVYLKEPLTRQIVAGLLFGVAGIVLLIIGEITRIAGSPLGLALMIISAIVWAVATIVFKRARFSVEPSVTTFWTLAISFIPLAAIGLIFEGWPADLPLTVWAAIGYNAIVIFIVCQTLWFAVLKIAPASISSLATLGVPVVSVVAGFVLLHETPKAADIGGLTLILISLAIVMMPRGRLSLARFRHRRGIDASAGPAMPAISEDEQIG